MIPIMLKQHKNNSGKEGKLIKINNYFFFDKKNWEKLIQRTKQNKQTETTHETSLEEAHFYQFYHVWDEFSKES